MFLLFIARINLKASNIYDKIKARKLCVTKIVGATSNNAYCCSRYLRQLIIGLCAE